jgi:hypothetical protein
MTVGNTGKVFASIHNLVLALTRQPKFHNAAQARRWFAPLFPVFEKAMQLRDYTVVFHS